MKIKETLTTAQKITLLNGSAVGIFPTMILSGDSFFGEIDELALGYYTEHSADKTISKAYEELKEFIEENDTVTQTAEQLMGKMVRNKFLEKWTRVYSALVSTDYNPLYEYEGETTRDGDNQDKITYASTIEKSGSTTNAGSYQDGTTKTGSEDVDVTYDTDLDTLTEKEVNTSKVISGNDESNIYGFNSAIPVGDNTSNTSRTETVTADPSDNTDHTLEQKTGTDTTDRSFSETDSSSGNSTSSTSLNNSEEKTGSDTTDYTIDEETSEHGRRTSASELIRKEIDFRSRQIFYDIVYRDIDSIVTLKIYV